MGILSGILSIVLGIYFTFQVFFRYVCLYFWYFWDTFLESWRHTPGHNYFYTQSAIYRVMK